MTDFRDGVSERSLTDDVVVVGAGPVGLATALGLARAGHRVTVLERAPATSSYSRAPILWPRSREILHGLGVGGRLDAAGTIVSELTLWDADRKRALLHLPFDELASETRWPGVLILPQSKTEALLARALERHRDAAVLFNAEVLRVSSGREGARVVYLDRRSGMRKERQARFVVGCDGAHSRVRRCVGASLEGYTYDVRAALADVELRSEREAPSPRISTRREPAVAIRIEPHVWRLILPFAADDGLDLDRRIERALDALFPESPARESNVLWKSEFELHRRNSTHYARGRVVLAGDAAHLNSPVGGQGMNAGIEDAEQLVDSLRRALKHDDCGVLEAWGERRRSETASGVNRFTDRLTRALLGGKGRMLKPTMHVAGLALRIPPLRRRALRALAMLPPPAPSDAKAPARDQASGERESFPRDREPEQESAAFP